jgi:hypothetical protein
MSSKYTLMNIIAIMGFKITQPQRSMNQKKKSLVKKRYNTKLIVHIYWVNRINNNCKVKRKKKKNIILK